MKKTLILLVGLFSMVCANAQLSRSVSEVLHTHVDEYEYIADKYNRFYSGLASKMISVELDKNEPDPTWCGGPMFGWTHGRPFKTTSLPLYWETGVRVSLSANETEDGDYDYTESEAFEVMVPFNLTFRFRPGEHFAISPFVGIYAAYSDASQSASHYECDLHGFDMGLQSGVNFDIRKFHIGFSAQPSFLKFNDCTSNVKSAHMVGFNVSVGMIFNKSRKVKK